MVAPRTGAWIETTYIGYTLRHMIVAPRTGAWIETNSSQKVAQPFWSPLAQGRGLKHVIIYHDNIQR